MGFYAELREKFKCFTGKKKSAFINGSGTARNCGGTQEKPEFIFHGLTLSKTGKGSVMWEPKWHIYNLGQSITS